jgi:hypothetical protein
MTAETTPGTPMRLSSRCLAAALLLAALPLAAAPGATQLDIDEDRFVAGGSVRQAQPVEGDLFGVGGNVDLAAGVKGDAVLGGGDVRVRDTVGQDLYAAGGNVRIESAVARNARVAGGNVELAPSASVGGNFSAAGGTIEVRGPVEGYLQAAGGNVLIDAAVGGDVKVATGTLELGPNARIAGRLVHSGPVTLRRDPGAVVSGGIERGAAVGLDRDRREGSRNGGWGWTLGLVALAAFIAGAFPAASRRMGEELRRDPAIGMLLGFITLVCVPVAAVILMVTIIGIPLAMAVLLLYLLMLVVGYAALAVVLGDAALTRLRARDAARAGWRVGAAALAMVALALLGKLPLVGGLVVFVALLAGLGAMVLAIRNRDRPQPAAA